MPWSVLAAALAALRSSAPRARALRAGLGEFRRRIPLWPLAAVREAIGDRVEQVGLLRRSPQIPAWRPCVAGLVITGRRERAQPLLACGTPAVDHVVRAGERHVEQHRHPALGEGEM